MITANLKPITIDNPEAGDSPRYQIQCNHGAGTGHRCGALLGYLMYAPTGGLFMYGDEQVTHIEAVPRSPVRYLEFLGYEVVGEMAAQSRWYIVCPEGYWFDDRKRDFCVIGSGKSRWRPGSRRRWDGSPAAMRVFEWRRDRSHRDDETLQERLSSIQHYPIGSTGFLPLTIQCPRCHMSNLVAEPH